MDGFDPDNAWWMWLVAGLVLATLEMLVPGVYLIWLAVAALATGALAFVAGPPLAMQVLSFVSLSLIAAFSAQRWLRDTPQESSDPLLNNRAARLVGQSGTVAEALREGSGRVRVGDGEWLAEGPDLPPGARVRITAVRGTVLVVEPAAPALIEG